MSDDVGCWDRTMAVRCEQRILGIGLAVLLLALWYRSGFEVEHVPVPMIADDAAASHDALGPEVLVRDQSPPWVEAALSLAARIEQRYPIWHQEQKAVRRAVVEGLARVDPQLGAQAARDLKAWPSAAARQAGEEMRAAIRELHEVTGYCAFADLPEETLLENAPLICARYRVHLANMSGASDEERARAGIAENIELLQTERWLEAMMYIQGHIAIFNRLIVCSDPPGAPWGSAQPDRDTLIAMCERMRQWWKRVSLELVWSPTRRRFEKYVPAPDETPDELVREGTWWLRMPLSMEMILGVEEIPSE